MSDDPYYMQMIEDLKTAEMHLRSDIENRNNPFRTDGTSRLKDSQANVDRLHELIRTYKDENEHANPKQEGQ